MPGARAGEKCIPYSIHMGRLILYDKMQKRIYWLWDDEMPHSSIMEVCMRLDKYLKVSRLIKRRTVANEACDSGRVMINDRTAKASAEVKQGDVITISFGNKEVKVEVLDVQETVKKDEAKELFRYL